MRQRREKMKNSDDQKYKLNKTRKPRITKNWNVNGEVVYWLLLFSSQIRMILA